MVPTFSLAKGRVSPRPSVECGEDPVDADDSHLGDEDEEEKSSRVSELADRVAPEELGFRINIGFPST